MFECVRYIRESYIIICSRRLYQFLYVNGQVYTKLFETTKYVHYDGELFEPTKRKTSVTLYSSASFEGPTFSSFVRPPSVRPSLPSFVPLSSDTTRLPADIRNFMQHYNMHEVRGTWYHVMQYDTQYFFCSMSLRQKSRKYVYTRADRAFSVCPCHENIVAGLYGRVLAVQGLLISAPYRI